MKNIAIDTETRLIKYPDQVNPDVVCMSVASARGTELFHFGYSRDLIRDYLRAWLRDDQTRLILQNGAFDLHVILKTIPELWADVWIALSAGRISDTMIREKLYLLSTVGNTHAQSCSLAAMVERYLGKDIEATKGEDAWRMRYGELMDVPLPDWPEAAVEYAVDDAVYTLQVWEEQEKIRQPRGPGSMNSEALQVAASFALRGMSIEGMRIDQDHVAKISKKYQSEYDAARAQMLEYGLLRESGTVDLSALRDLVTELGSEAVTAKGQVAVDRKTIAKIVSDDPRLAAYKRYSDVLKPVTTFIPQMGFDRIHPRFNPLINTLRTSCSSSNYYKYGGKQYGKKVIRMGDPVPSINLQQIPRSDDFRNGFIPEVGHQMVCADYANLELVCAAQTFYSLFGKSQMRDVLNSGLNLHDATGCLIYHDFKKISIADAITVEQFRQLIADGDADAKFCRQTAKFVNLGCPGGQSAKTIYKLANSMGIEITLQQAERWREAARDRYPEFAKFFSDILPNLQSGSMYIKTDDGMVRTQRYDGEIHGVWKARATYTAMANSITMQLPAAIGKKHAMMRIYRECTDPTLGSVLHGAVMHLDMHDEFILSVRDDIATECRQRICELMVEGMQKVLPDMRVGVEAVLLDRWAKDGDDAIEYHKEPLTRSI